MTDLDFDGFMTARLPGLIELMPHFPVRCCLDTCRHILDDLKALWGGVKEVQGYFWDPEAGSHTKPHAWLEWDGVIVRTRLAGGWVLQPGPRARSTPPPQAAVRPTSRLHEPSTVVPRS